MTTRTRWLTAATAVLGYVLLWLGWTQHWAWLTAFDHAWLDPAYRYGIARPGWVRAWNGLCMVFHPAVFELAALVIGVVALLRGHRRRGLFLLAGVAVAGVVTEVAKDLAQRPRPLTALVQASSWSFPSGHALGTMAGALGLCVVLLPMLSVTWRRVAVVAAVVVVGFVGVGRVVLNVHHPSDVLAGWLLGYLWFVLCLPILGSPGHPAVPEDLPSGSVSDDRSHRSKPDRV